MELKCTGKTRLRTGHKTILSLIRCVSLAEQPRENTNKYHYDATTRDKEPGGTNPRVVGVLDHTTGWTMQFRKPKNWNEPLSHDSFALLAPKNRNNRNRELERKGVKEKPRILFQKSSTAVCAWPRDPRQSKRDGFLHTLPQPVQRNRV